MNASKKANLQDYIEYIYKHLERTKNDTPNREIPLMEQLFPDAKNVNEKEILNFIREHKIADRFLHKHKRVHPILPQTIFRLQGAGKVRIYSLDALGKVYLELKLKTQAQTSEVIARMGVNRSLLCYISNITKEYNKITSTSGKQSPHVRNYVKRNVQKDGNISQETITELVNSFTQLIQALTKIVK